MDDFKTIARLLAAVKIGQDMPVFNCALVDEKTLRTSAAVRDRLAVTLRDEGLIDGLFVVDDIDNQAFPVILWPRSHPRLTLKGMEYLRDNRTVRKALQELKDAGIAVASQAIANAINGMV